MTDKNSINDLHKQAESLLDGGRVTEARAIYEKICGLDENDADGWLMMGSIDGETGRVDQAILNVQKSISIDPEYADAYLILARLMMVSKKPEEARIALRKAVGLDPLYTDAWSILAAIEGQLQNYAEAEICSRQVLQQNAADIEAQMNLGNALFAQGKYDESAISYEIVTRKQPNLAIAWVRLSMALLQMGRLESAEEAVKRSLRLNPNDFDALLCSARIHVEGGHGQAAIRELQEILLQNPDKTEAWSVLTQTCARYDELDTWVECCRKIARTHPESGRAWFGFGSALEHAGSIEQAEESYRRAVKYEANLHEAWSRLGVVCARLDRFDAAMEYFMEALAQGSCAAVTHCGYGSMLRRKGLFIDSERHCRIATELAPDWGPGMCELARVLIDLGRVDEAIDTFRKAMSVEPESQEAAAGLAEAYERKGMHEEAYSALRPFMEERVSNSQIACVFAKLSGVLDRHEEALSHLYSVLVDVENLSAQQQVDLHFRAAEIHRAEKRYDKAMRHYHLGNALKSMRYDPQVHAKFISGLIALISEELLACLPQVADSSDRPVFIVGMPRSGTTLVEQLLASHDDVAGAGELMEISNAASSLGIRAGFSLPTKSELVAKLEEGLNRITNEYLSKLDSLSTNEIRVTDKMPGNFMHLWLIQTLFPAARVIHIRRDPMDTCLSCYFTDFNGVHEYAYDLESLGHYYREYERLMDHWCEVLSIPVMEINYEDLVSNFDNVSRRIVEFCGLDWDPKVLEYYMSDRPISTASYQQVKNPVYTSSVGRWKRYMEHLGPLCNALSL